MKFIRITGVIRPGWHRIRIPVIERIGFGNLYYSPNWMSGLLGKIMKYRSGLFIDIGANTGQTLIAVKSIDPMQPYLGFEPESHSFNCLTALVKENKFSEVRLVPAGISDKNGLVKFYRRKPADSGASMIGPRDSRHLKFYECVYAAVYQFDSIYRDLVPESDLQPAIVKIDVEGAELEVIGGMNHFIAATRPFIICEVLYSISPSAVEGDRQRRMRLAGLLKNHQYRISQVIEESGTKFGVREISEFPVSEYFPGSRKMNNYLFIPEEFYQAYSALLEIKDLDTKTSLH